MLLHVAFDADFPVSRVRYYAWVIIHKYIIYPTNEISLFLISVQKKRSLPTAVKLQPPQAPTVPRSHSDRKNSFLLHVAH